MLEKNTTVGLIFHSPQNVSDMDVLEAWQELKLKEGRFRLHIRDKFFMMKVMKYWHRLPRQAVDAPSVETFKARLDGVLSNLV